MSVQKKSVGMNERIKYIVLQYKLSSFKMNGNCGVGLVSFFFDFNALSTA